MNNESRSMLEKMSEYLPDIAKFLSDDELIFRVYEIYKYNIERLSVIARVSDDFPLTYLVYEVENRYEKTVDLGFEHEFYSDLDMLIGPQPTFSQGRNLTERLKEAVQTKYRYDDAEMEYQNGIWERARKLSGLAIDESWGVSPLTMLDMAIKRYQSEETGNVV